eukprot:2613314-Prymnesium_polylepis.1
MKRAVKKKLSVPEPPQDEPPDACAAGSPPRSPPKAAVKAVAARVPPSSGKEKINWAADALKYLKARAMQHAYAVGDAEKRFDEAKVIFHRKCDAIE